MTLGFQTPKRLKATHVYNKHMYYIRALIFNCFSHFFPKIIDLQITQPFQF